MTAAITRLSGQEAYDLIYPDYLAMLPESEKATMANFMLKSQVVWVGYEDNKVLCYLGLIPPTLLSDTAYLWLNVTEHMQAHVFIFVRYSQRVVEDMLDQFPRIIGHCELANHRAQRWLRWLGATFGEPIDDKALPFEIRRRHNG